MSTHPSLWTTPLIVATLLISAPLTARGQVRVPGVTGTFALPTSVDKFYSDMNKILVATSDAVEHIAGESNDAEGSRQRCIARRIAARHGGRRAVRREGHCNIKPRDAQREHRHRSRQGQEANHGRVQRRWNGNASPLETRRVFGRPSAKPRRRVSPGRVRSDGGCVFQAGCAMKVYLVPDGTHIA